MFTWFIDILAAKSDKRTTKRIAHYARKERILAAKYKLRATRKYGYKAAINTVRVKTP
jgi:hypothetical protein